MGSRPVCTEECNCRDVAVERRAALLKVMCGRAWALVRLAGQKITMVVLEWVWHLNLKVAGTMHLGIVKWDGERDVG